MTKKNLNYIIFLTLAAVIFVAGNVLKQANRSEPEQAKAQPPPKKIKRVHIEGPLGMPVDLCRVIDGDTIEVEYLGEQEKVRLLNLDTVERGEPGYGEATEALKKILTGQYISLEFEEKGVEKRDMNNEIRNNEIRTVIKLE